MRYITNRFKEYTEADCSCEYCLFYSGKRCQLETCCCEEERRLARQQKIIQLSPQMVNQLESAEISVLELGCKCDNCNFAGHGFICGDAYGPCMKNGYRADFSCVA